MRRARKRSGLTLYEVLLAVAVMLAAMAVVSGHISVGTRAGVTSKLQTTAVLLCETKLNEVLAGVEPMVSTSEQPLPDDDGQWTWSMTVSPGPVETVMIVDVTVEHAGDRPLNTIRYTLRRVVRDPALFLEPLDTEAATVGGSE